jgi:hypothetical protein
VYASTGPRRDPRRYRPYCPVLYCAPYTVHAVAAMALCTCMKMTRDVQWGLSTVRNKPRATRVPLSASSTVPVDSRGMDWPVDAGEGVVRHGRWIGKGW